MRTLFALLAMLTLAGSSAALAVNMEGIAGATSAAKAAVVVGTAKVGVNGAFGTGLVVSSDPAQAGVSANADAQASADVAGSTPAFTQNAVEVKDGIYYEIRDEWKPKEQRMVLLSGFAFDLDSKQVYSFKAGVKQMAADSPAVDSAASVRSYGMIRLSPRITATAAEKSMTYALAKVQFSYEKGSLSALLVQPQAASDNAPDATARVDSIALTRFQVDAQDAAGLIWTGSISIDGKEYRVIARETKPVFATHAIVKSSAGIKTVSGTPAREKPVRAEPVPFAVVKDVANGQKPVVTMESEERKKCEANGGVVRVISAVAAKSAVPTPTSIATSSRVFVREVCVMPVTAEEFGQIKATTTTVAAVATAN